MHASAGPATLPSHGWTAGKGDLTLEKTTRARLAQAWGSTEGPLALYRGVRVLPTAHLLSKRLFGMLLQAGALVARGALFSAGQMLGYDGMKVGGYIRLIEGRSDLFSELTPTPAYNLALLHTFPGVQTSSHKYQISYARLRHVES